MSEIQDAAQIIRVSFEGAEIILKLGKANLDFLKGVCAVFKKMLDQEKLSGKTSVKQLLKSGGDLQVFKFQTEDLATVKKMADKYGILYSILPDLNKSDGMSEILFHSQAAPRIKAIMEQIQNAKIETMDDYFANAEPEELEKTLRDEQKKSGMPKEKEYRVTAEEILRNPGAKVSDIRSRLNMTWLEIWPVVKHMEGNGLAELGKDGTVSMKMDAEQFREFMDSAQWKAWFGGREAGQRHEAGNALPDDKMEELKRIQKESKDNPKVNGITIDRKMVVEETEKNIKTRIPYKRDEYIWLRKSEITWINSNKTIYAGLEKEKTYQVLDASNQPVRRVTGQQLYEQSYDPVNREQVKRQQEQQKKRERQQKKKEYQQAQTALESAKKTVTGRGGR